MPAAAAVILLALNTFCRNFCRGALAAGAALSGLPKRLPGCGQGVFISAAGDNLS